MIRSTKTFSRLAFALALAALADRARADSNFRPYVVGARAAGMGGAFTALADDGSGPFYNPGGIAFVSRSQLSLSGSVYGIVGGTLEDAVGNGNDFTYRNLNVFPSTTSGVWKLGDPEATSANVLAFSVIVPDAIDVDDRDAVGSSDNAFFFSNEVQTVWAGLTYARRMGRLGIGATGFFLMGTRLSQLDLTVAASANQFQTLTSRIDESTYGFVGALGARWDVTDHLRLGASVYSPAVGRGSRRVFARIVAGQDGQPGGIAADHVDDLRASPSDPFRAQLGVAWSSGPLTLAADGIWLAPRTVTDDAGNALQRRIVREQVLNGALGLEYVLADRYPLRAGFFTDFSAAKNPPDPNVGNTSHIDRLGGTLSIGYRTQHTSSDLGVNVSGGSGRNVVPDNLNFGQSKVTRASQLLVYIFLGTSYQF
jgi:long-chain fatty acid transport protein